MSQQGQGYALDKNLIVFLIILGAACAVAMGYGMHRAIATRQSNNEYQTGMKERNGDQDQYMIDLRMAHRDAIMEEARYQPRRAKVQDTLSTSTGF